MKRLIELTDEEKQILIAEACGWSDFGRGLDGPLIGRCGNNPFRLTIPDYLHSLDAMREAEKTLSETRIYQEHLERIVWERSHYGPWHASSTERADAFLLTIVSATI